MCITEVALIKIKPGFSADHLTLRLKLGHAKRAMQDFAGRPFHWMQQVEDPSFLYVIGEWESLEQHMDVFIPSSANQALLQSLKDEIAVEWLMHLDVPQHELPFPETNLEKEKAAKGEIIYSITRHFVKESLRSKFSEVFENNSHHLQDFITEGKLGGGRRVEKDGALEECVIICPWKTIKQHYDFQGTDAFANYSSILKIAELVDTKHMRLLDV